MQTKRNCLSRNQAGMASIVITTVIMVVLSLITLGFARIIAREQRQTLDRQLSTQAFYAAETGLNEAIEKIRGGYSGSKTDCGEQLPDFPGDGTINAAANVQYSCLLINAAPPNLQYDSVGTKEPTVVPISSETGEVITRLQISWQSTDGSSNFSSLNLGDFENITNWGAKTGILRVALADLTGSIDRTGLNNANFTTFLYPKQAPSANQRGAVSYSRSGSVAERTQQGVVGDGRCHATNQGTQANPLQCTVEITGLNANNYLMQMRSIYAASSVTIVAYNSAGNVVNLQGAQSIIDSTGRATDVFRRIQVRLPSQGNSYPGFALETAEEICKRYEVAPGYLQDACDNRTIVPPIDVCPNIAGQQTSVPAGMIKDSNGNCVTPPGTTSPPPQFTNICYQPGWTAVVNYGWHISMNSSSEYRKGPIGVNISPGTYQIYVQSHDPHSTMGTNPWRYQPNEQHIVELHGASGLIGELGPTSDIPDNQDFIWTSFTFTVSQPVTAIYVRHALPLNTAATVSNSHDALCTAFQRQ